MTNSSEINNTPPVKTKGPLRHEAVIPVAIVYALVFIYFHFFFDGNIRRAIEWGGTYVQGAEVNVGSVKTSFFGGSFALYNLQLTDKTQPTRNLIQIGQIRFQFLWDALLRAKFVVNDAGIDGIEIYSPRKTPGYVKPPEPPSNKPSALAKVQENVLNQTKEQYSDNTLGDIAALLGGTSQQDVLKNIEGTLKSEAKMKELEAELNNKQKAWKERLNKLPQKAEFDDLAKRAKALKFDSRDPKGFAQSLQDAAKIGKEADEKLKSVKSTTDELQADMNKYNAEIKDLDALVKQDMADIEKRLNIPNIDMKDFSKNLFLKMFATKLGSMQKYLVLARQYMPAKNSKTAQVGAEKKDELLIPRKRNQGVNYRFPITTGYPLFWLKRATISSEPTSEGFAGKVHGSLTNVTSSPEAIGKPAILDVDGDFPKAEVYGSHLKIVADHIAEPRDSIELSVASYPFLNQSLVTSPSLTLGVKKADGGANLKAELVSEEVAVNLNNEFKKVDYDLKASGAAQEALQSILNGIPVITLTASAKGSWDHLNIDMDSNLGRELAAGVKKYVQDKVDTMRKKVKDQIDSKIGPQKEKLTGDYNKVKGQMDSTLNAEKQEADKSKNEVTKDTKSKAPAIPSDLQEKGKKLLKGLHF